MDDIFDISDLENKLHKKFDRIDYENLTAGERMRLLSALGNLNTVVDSVLTKGKQNVT